MFELLFKDALKNFLLEDLGVEGDVTSKHLGLDGVQVEQLQSRRVRGSGVSHHDY